MKAHTIDKVALTEEKSLKTLVENRTSYTLDSCELNVFETHQRSEFVSLTFNDFVVTSMLRGKKVMHLFDDPAFEYVPGETVVVPAGITMKIDFPEARKENPTQCIALAIDHQKIQNTLNNLNDKYPRTGDSPYWVLHRSNYHFLNNIELAQTINKLISICSQGSVCKDVLADLALQELIVSIVQVQNLHNTHAEPSNNNPLDFITSFIKANITEEIRLDTLSQKACMSKATFYRSFKREFGISPQEYIIGERIRKAKQLLQQPNTTVKSVCFECGFSDVNYFIRLFKNIEGITPKQFQLVSNKQILPS